MTQTRRRQRGVAAHGSLGAAVLVGLVLLVGLGLLAPTSAQECPTSRSPLSVPAARLPVGTVGRPNVLLITADDMRADELRFMPFTAHAFRRRGVTFADAVSPYPLCCPARAQILTGQYNHNNGVLGNVWPNGGYWALRDRYNTLPVWLARNGYTTAFLGKYLNEYGTTVSQLPATHAQLTCRDGDEVPPGWEHWYADVGSVFAYNHATLRVDTPSTRPHAVYVGSYQTDYVSGLTTDLIRRFHRQQRPFFIWASHLAPHMANTDGSWGPPVPADRDVGLYDGLPLPRTAGYRDSFNALPADGPGAVQHRGPLRRAEVRATYDRRAESLLSLDRAVQAAVRQLRHSHEYRQTVIIFTSDNGYLLGEHRLRGKDQPYEPALRVPMIINGPGIERRYARGRARRRLTVPYTVTMTDIAATIVGVTGSRPGRVLDGIDMTRPAQNPDSHRGGDRVVLVESGPATGAAVGTQKYLGVRTDRWTWFAWDWSARGDRHGPPELYDRIAEPSQTHNRVGRSPAEAPLRRLASEMRRCRGAACVRDFSTSDMPR